MEHHGTSSMEIPSYLDKVLAISFALQIPKSSFNVGPV